MYWALVAAGYARVNFRFLISGLIGEVPKSTTKYEKKGLDVCVSC